METIKIDFSTADKAKQVVRAMKALIKDVDYATIGDLNDLIGRDSTYSDHCYGWTNLNGWCIDWAYMQFGVTLTLPKPKPIQKKCKPCMSCKECTDGSNFKKDLEDCAKAYCVADCMATENIILTQEKEELQKELAEYIEKCRVHTEQIMSLKGKLELWQVYSQSLDNKNDELDRELEDTKLLVELVKKDNAHLKTELKYLSNFIYARVRNGGCITDKDLGVIAQIIIDTYRNKED